MATTGWSEVHPTVSSASSASFLRELKAGCLVKATERKQTKPGIELREGQLKSIGMPDLGSSLLELRAGIEAEFEFGLPVLWAIGSTQSVRTIIGQDSEGHLNPLLTSAAEQATKSFVIDRSIGFRQFQCSECFTAASSEFVLNQTQRCFMRVKQGLKIMKEGFVIAKSAGHQLAEEATRVDLLDSAAIEAARSRLIE